MRTYKEYCSEVLAAKAVKYENYKKFRISVTDIDTWKRCGFKHYLTGRNGLHLEPKIPNPDFVFGSAMHKALESYYNGDEKKYVVNAFNSVWYSAMIPKTELMEAKVSLEMGHDIIDHYINYAPSVDQNLKILSTELEWEYYTDITFTHGMNQFVVVLHGTFDAIALRNNVLYVIEHKTYRTAPEEGAWEFSNQLNLYLWVASLMFDAPVEGLVNGLRKKVPSIPQLLKDQTRLSKAKIATTYEIFYQTILNYAFNPNDYREVLDNLKSQPNPFFYRERVRLNQLMFREMWNVLKTELSLLAQTTLKKQHVYSLSTLCTWDCAYHAICNMSRKGSDWSKYVENNYNYREV